MGEGPCISACVVFQANVRHGWDTCELGRIFYSGRPVENTLSDHWEEGEDIWTFGPQFIYGVSLDGASGLDKEMVSELRYMERYYRHQKTYFIGKKSNWAKIFNFISCSLYFACLTTSQTYLRHFPYWNLIIYILDEFKYSYMALKRHLN